MLDGFRATGRVGYYKGDNRMSREQVIERCKFELATNFECPSQQILGVYGAKLGLSWDKMRDLLESLID